MKHWRNKLLFLAGGAALILAVPALSQQAEPVLPPGFGDPGRPPAPPPPPPPPPQTEDVESETTVSSPVRRARPSITNTAEKDLEALPQRRGPPPIEIPEHARRSADVVGPLAAQNGGLGAGAFQGGNGQFLSGLMRRLDAPLPSRWTSMLLRRGLLSQVPAPAAIDPVDWVAERAWLLLRMGEADAARMLVQSVDVDRFTPRMYSVAVQTALATADPAGLCPLVAGGRSTSDEHVWPLAEAMCAALEGEASRASALIDQTRRRLGDGNIDHMLAEKIVGAGANTRRAVTIEWDEVQQINSWRFGLASATGLEFPEALRNGFSPHVRAWHARAPMIPLDRRLQSARIAAALGVFSNASLVEMYSLIADGTDPADFRGTPAWQLRRAYVGNPAQRIEALRSLWNENGDGLQHYGQLILTARASARIPASSELGQDAPMLIASMLSAGMDGEAARWSDVVGGMSGERGDRAWALLAVGSLRPTVDIAAARINTFRDNDESANRQRSQMLVAALAGLRRIEGREMQRLAETVGVDLGRRNSWNQMLEVAARNGQPGTVALLAGVGMQTPSWRGVPPEHLYHILRALTQVGREYEARMIAAEALTRL
jgi:hypothetical protein